MEKWEKVDDILFDIVQEIEYAENKWGDEFDSKNTANDWWSYATVYAGKALAMPFDGDNYRKMLVKVAGLVVNAILWYDMGKLPKRHYD